MPHSTVTTVGSTQAGLADLPVESADAGLIGGPRCSFAVGGLDHRDVAVTDAQQMPDGLLRGEFVVDADPRLVIPPGDGPRRTRWAAPSWSRRVRSRVVSGTETTITASTLRRNGSASKKRCRAAESGNAHSTRSTPTVSNSPAIPASIVE